MVDDVQCLNILLAVFVRSVPYNLLPNSNKILTGRNEKQWGRTMESRHTVKNELREM